MRFVPTSSTARKTTNARSPSPVFSLLLRFILARENRLRQSTTSSAPTSSDPEKVDDSCASSVVSDEEQERIEREDLTDRENKRFRYTL